MSTFTSRLLLGSLMTIGLVLGLSRSTQPTQAAQLAQADQPTQPQQPTQATLPFQAVRTDIKEAIPENRSEIVTNFLATNAGTLIQNATNQNRGDLLNDLEFPLAQTVRSLLPVVLVGTEVSLEQPTSNLVIIAAQTAIINAPVGGEVYVLALSLDIKAPVAGKVTAITTQLKSSSPITLELMSPFAVGKLLWQEIDARRPVEPVAPIEDTVQSGAVDGNQAIEEAELQSSVLLPSSIASSAQPSKPSKWNLQIVKPVMAQANEVTAESTMTELTQEAVGINWGAVARATQTGLATIVSLWLLVFFMPRLIHDTSDSILSKPFTNILWGINGIIVIPTLAVILLFTKIGLSVSLILFFLYGVALLLSTWMVALAIGKVTVGVFQKRWPQQLWLSSPYIWAVLGGVMLSILMNLPWIGGLITLISFTIGFGSLMLWTNNLRLPSAKK